MGWGYRSPGSRSRNPRALARGSARERTAAGLVRVLIGLRLSP